MDPLLAQHTPSTADRTTTTPKKRNGAAKRLANIQRIAYPEKQTFGWLVRVEQRGVKYRKLFSDGVHGGKQEALAMAIQYRDNIKQRMGHGYSLWRRSILQKNNTSGIPGVGRYVRSDIKAGEWAFWCASWDDASGRRRSRRFSVARYGEDQARRLAIRERKERLQESVHTKIATAPSPDPGHLDSPSKPARRPR